jgi:ribosome-binding factor A
MNKKQNYKRAVRIADIIKKEIAKIFLFELNDSRFLNITITDLKLSDDLSIAKIYYVSTNSYSIEVHDALVNVIGYIKKKLSKTLTLRKLPDFTFYYDEVFENGFKIDKILNSIKD